MAEALISTAVGEFSSSYLAKEAGKNIAQFIAKYGSTAFQRVAPLVTGGMILEKVLEAAPPLDLQQEKLFGMPVRHITGQGEVYSDIDEPKKEEPLKYIPGIHGPKTKEQEELEKSLREPKGTPVEPIAPFPPLVTPIPKQEKEKPEGLPIPTQEKEKPEGLPIPEQKTWRDYVLTKDKPKDITKQTKELVSDITADVSKEKADKYFEGIDELYDNEWYGSVKNIQYAIDHGLEISEDDSLLYEKYGQKNPVHEYFEDEWGGGVAEGNTDAAKVMNAAFGASLGEINTPSYYQEYLEKLHEYTLNTLGKEFKAYRLASKAEMEELITSQKENYKSFSLNKNQALAFQHLVGKHYREEGGVGETREDLVLIEAVIPYDSLVMRGRSDEKEIVVSGIGINGEEFNFYDLKGNLIQGATEGPLVKDITKQTEELVSGTEEDFTEGLKEYEEVYSPERFKKANDEYPELSPANNKKIVEADKHFGAIALARIYGHNSNETQLIYLTPQEYLDLTKQFGRIDGTWSPGGKAIIKYLEGKIKDGKEIGEIPILSVSKQGENYLVNGQEGRHRAQAFKNQGYNKIPVRIEGSGKNKESGVENKVYTATKRSYLYTEDWTQDYIGFIPKNIISKSDYNKDTEQYESWESKSVKPGDFYDVASKKKLFVENDVTKQTEELVKKELSVSQQTKNLTSKIKNKITTWEDHFPTIEEATKAAKDVGGTLREFEEGVLYKKITFRQHNYGFDIYFDKKLIGGLNDVDPYKEDPNRKGNQKSYNLNYINEEGHDDEAFTTIDGQKYAKEKAKELIARDLLRETEESTDPLYPTSPTLRDVFQNLEYNKKGEPKDVAEGIEKTLKELEEYKEKNKKALGGLSEKELLFLKDLRVFGVPERASYTFDSKIKKLSEGEKVNLTKKEADDLSDYMFTRFESQEGTDEAIFDSTDDLELLDKKLRKK